MNSIVYILDEICKNSSYSNCSFPLFNARYNEPVTDKNSFLVLMKNTHTNIDEINRTIT